MDAAVTHPKSSWPTLALLAALAVAPYLNALAAGFTLDDIPNIRENAVVTGDFDVVGILSTPLPLMANLYRPVTVLTFALNEQFSPGYAPAFHAVNVVLHAAVTLVVFWLAVRLFNSARGAVIAAMLFAVHPIHTEAVTSLVGRAELLAAFFGLIAVGSAARVEAAASATSRWGLQALSVIAYALAQFSKESAATLLPLIILFRATRRGTSLWQGVRQELRTLNWVPYALCTAVFIAARREVVGSLTFGDNLAPLDNALGFVPWDVRLRSALGVVWDYFGLLNFPLVLSADYSYHQVPLVTSWFDARFLAGGVVALAGVALLFKRGRPALGFCAIFPLVALSLTANLFFAIGTIKAERLLYLPSVGWALLIGYAIDHFLRLPRYQLITTFVLTLVVGTFATRTWTRNWDWRDNATLFESMVRSAPDSAKAHYNLGVALRDRGAPAAADEHFRRALDIMPKTEGAAFGIAAGLDVRGSIVEAAAWYHRALEIDPGYLVAHQNLCRLYFMSEQFAAAATACRRGLRSNPTDADLLKGLGASLVAQGETEKGVEVLRRALRRNERDNQLRTYVAQLEGTPTAHDRGLVTLQ